MSDGGKILFFSHTSPTDPPRDTENENVLPEEDAATALERLTRLLVAHEADPYAPLAGYLITGDPAYLPDLPEARALAHRVGRDTLLEAMIGLYLKEHIDSK